MTWAWTTIIAAKSSDGATRARPPPAKRDSTARLPWATARALPRWRWHRQGHITSGRQPRCWRHGTINTAAGPQEHRMPTPMTRLSVTTSLLLALAAGVGLALWPCAYEGVEAQSTPGGAGQERQLCATLVEMNGVDVLGVLALPVLLAGVGLATVRAGRRGILLTVTVALVAFCLLALASVGLYYAPAAVALVIAVGGWRPERDPTSSG